MDIDESPAFAQVKAGLSCCDELEIAPRAAQAELASLPYDRWVVPDGGTSAEFHRLPEGFLLRFPQLADFMIDADCGKVRCIPTPAIADATITSLYNNAVLPLMGNHLGQLNLHGSAVVVDGSAVAFLGLSRSGKTTLASAFARSGHPFLTEDVVELGNESQGYMVQPKRPVVRLFADSARHLRLCDGEGSDATGKQEIGVADALPVATGPARLAALFVLGDGSAQDVAIEPLAGASAAALLMPNAFVLDVEDKARLLGHFERMVALAGDVPCYRLDYPRDYQQLPAVVTAIETLIARQENV